MRSQEIVVKAEHGEYTFKSWMMPLLLKIKDIEALNVVVKQPGFVFSKVDLNSFVTYAFNDRWIQGLKAFLTSAAA